MRKAMIDDEKIELASQLAFLYLEKADTSKLSPSDFTEKYFDVKQEIYRAVKKHCEGG